MNDHVVDDAVERVGEPEIARRLVSRRALIHASGTAVLAGVVSACTNSTERRVRRRTPTTTAPPDGDVALLIAALAEEENLLGYCTDLISQHPGLTAVVAPVRQRQRQHVDTLRSALRRIDPATSQPRVPVPGGAGSAEAKLSRLVANAQRRRFEDCLAAESGLLARLLASTSASHAVTVLLLTEQR